MKNIELILLYSQLNTVDRLYIPKELTNTLSKKNYIKSIKRRIKQLKYEKSRCKK